MSLERLLKQGARAMADARYEDAVEIYSEACQMANLESGKDDPDLMYLYGKALFENAVQSSDVLGAAGANSKAQKKQNGAGNGDGVDNEKKNEESKDGQFHFNEALAEDEEEEEDEDEDASEEGEDNDEKQQKQDDSSDEEVEAPEGEEEEEPEQSDFEIAWEILDLTRLLYNEQLGQLSTVPTPYIEHIDEGREFVNKYTRLSDVYMLMGDISLENENFIQAIEDYEKGNEMLLKIFPPSSGRRHEAMFKLSLAYEFIGDDEGLSKAIKSMEDVLNMLSTKSDSDKQKDGDILEEVESRLNDLKTLQRQRAAEKQQIMGLLKGVTGSVNSGDKGNNGGSQVRDLSGLVKRKKVKKEGRVNK